MSRDHHILHAGNSKHRRAEPRSESSHAWIGAGIASAFTVFSALLMTHSVSGYGHEPVSMSMSTVRASSVASFERAADGEDLARHPVQAAEASDEPAEPYVGLRFRPPLLERAGLAR